MVRSSTVLRLPNQLVLDQLKPGGRGGRDLDDAEVDARARRVDQPRALAAAIVPLTRAAVRLATRRTVMRRMVRDMAPSALPLLDQVLTKETPLRDEVPTVAEARSRFGKLKLGRED